MYGKTKYKMSLEKLPRHSACRLGSAFPQKDRIRHSLLKFGLRQTGELQIISHQIVDRIHLPIYLIGKLSLHTKKE